MEGITFLSGMNAAKVFEGRNTGGIQYLCFNFVKGPRKLKSSPENSSCFNSSVTNSKGPSLYESFQIYESVVGSPNDKSLLPK